MTTLKQFVGDRGFLHPELTHSATEEEVAELGNQKISIGTSVAIAPVKSV